MLLLNEQFSILFIARSGSSYLQDTLNNHPNITCTNEDMFVNHIYFNRSLNPDYDYHPCTRHGYSGIKVPLTILEKHPLGSSFWENNIFRKPVIICTRNFLLSYISYELVKANNSAWSQLKYKNPILINISDAMRYIKTLNEMLEPFKHLSNQKILWLNYEDGVENNYYKALNFIGAHKYKPVVSYTKQTDREYKHLIINYEQMMKSPLGSFLKM